MITTMFPHLDPDASWTVQQEAGDRLRAIYTAGASERQIRAIGKAHLGGRTLWGWQPMFFIGLDNPMAMCRGIVIHRAMARQYPQDRRHHVTNALRLRGALCWWGLDTKMRKP